MSARLMDDNDLIQIIADTFLADMPVQVEQLKASIDDNDCDQAAALAHKIKGAASNVGADVFSAVAFTMEQAGKSGDIEKIKQTYTELEQCFSQLKSTMEETIK